MKDPGPSSGFEGAAPPETLSDGKVSLQGWNWRGRGSGAGLASPRSDHTMPVHGGSLVKAVPKLQRAMGKAS